MNYKSEEYKSIYETAYALYRLGLVDDITITEYLERCCTNIEESDLI